MRTDFVRHYPDLAPLFDRSKCENVVTKKEECTNSKCMQEDNCRLDRGAPFCYEGSDKSRAMLDPYWIGGPDKHSKRTSVKSVFLLKRDPISPPIEKLDPEVAISFLEEGRSQTSTGGYKNEPFFNPHLLVRNQERIELQKRNFARLFNIATPYFVNTSAESTGELQARIRGIIAER